MKRRLPVPALNIFINWYFKAGFITEDKALSRNLRVRGKIGQGGVLCGVSFILYINPLIKKLRESSS